MLSLSQFLQEKLDDDAHKAATSPKNTFAHPSDAQKQAGNYRKGHTKVSGLDIAIENPKGSKRRPAWPKLKHHYGYFKRTKGGDNENVDVFVKPGSDNYDGPVHVVNQTRANGDFDEHKVMLGFRNKANATRAYKANYTPDWDRIQSVKTFGNIKTFKDWLHSDAARKPA